ncbi:hypothetical protein L7F22_006658 [Adiantum nelumboides]|nr:hypothetical protein [Adiantum nelumboides]
MSSGWVEDFLIEFFLESSSGGHCPGEEAQLRTELEENGLVNGNLSGAEEYGTDAVIPEESRIGQGACESQQAGDDLDYERVRKQHFGLLSTLSFPGVHSIENAECLEEASAEDERMLEAWQAQYGQVVRSDVEAEACPRAISLWNWTTLVSKRKFKSKTSLRLLGQLAQTSSRLPHSLQHHSGFIRTSDVSEVNLDLVKVSSGEIFRLRQPSMKYLSSIPMYDSSNPTEGWNFPCLTLCSLKESSETVACAVSKTSANPAITKPFIPNWNHHRYQQIEEKKVASPAIPAGLRALSGKERASSDERKRKYRDRAKERRQQYVDEEEDCGSRMQYIKHGPLSLAKDARPLKGKQILERMGWCEGESIGKRKDGLIRPLDAACSHGRAGIGWFPSND